MVVGMRTVVDIQADPVALLRQLDRVGAGADMRTLRADGPDTRANIEEYAQLWSIAPHVMGSPGTSGLANPGGMPPVTVHGSGACPHSNQRIGHRVVRHPFSCCLSGGCLTRAAPEVS
jgi:hypothetical protein